jgi:acetylserotonin N-methyltransferase
MFAAVSMGIFDLLETGPLDAASIASKIAAHPDAAERLLDSSVALGLLEKSGAAYANTPAASAYLCRASPQALTGYILYSNDVLFALWKHLEDAVRDGTHRWEQTFGTSGPLFDSFFPTEEKMRTFTMGMHGMGVLSSPAVVAAFDLNGFRKLVDLGGATGHLTIAACERYPALHGTVLDSAKVLKVAQEQIALSPARDRIDCVAADFFTDELPPADLYALGRILHDWTEEKIDLLLTRIYARLPAGGAVLIAEKLLNDSHTGPVHVHMQSLNMLICTEGKERSLPEYRALLARTGFTEVAGVRTGKPVDAVLARKL